MQERREYEVPFRERERDDGYRRQQRGPDPWGRPTRAAPRREIREPPPLRREQMLVDRREPMPQLREPIPQRLDPMPQRMEPMPQRVEPLPQHREPARERYFCPNCTCRSCRPDDFAYRAAGGGGGVAYQTGGVVDDHMRPRYEALPPPNDGYFPREHRPLQGEPPMERERPWPVQDQRAGDLAGHRVAYNGGQNGVFNGGQRDGPPRDGFQRRPGDWDCPQCSGHNFATRTTCFKCNIPKPENRPAPSVNQGRGEGGGRRVAITRRPGDWNCHECNAHNFSRNTSCFKCKIPKEK